MINKKEKECVAIRIGQVLKYGLYFIVVKDVFSIGNRKETQAFVTAKNNSGISDEWVVRVVNKKYNT